MTCLFGLLGGEEAIFGKGIKKNTKGAVIFSMYRRKKIK